MPKGFDNHPRQKNVTAEIHKEAVELSGFRGLAQAGGSKSEGVGLLAREEDDRFQADLED